MELRAEFASVLFYPYTHGMRDMIGFEAAAFINPDLDKVKGIFSEVSHTVERPLDEFDRSHSKSISKRQVRLAVEKTDSIIDEVHAQVLSGAEMVSTLRNGNEDELQKLELKEGSEHLLEALLSALTTGNNHLAYSFFKAEADPAWGPHIPHLHYIKRKSMQAFGEYKQITEELYHLVTLHLTQSDDNFSIDMAAMSESIESDTIHHPDWVKDGDDFVAWIQSMNKEV
ncbi:MULTISPECIES: hypothetical protein [Serratia]|uniref:hypothetical protein n=1 Tax=Serratia TaxID=613 RepID=UPI0010205F09|nr:MULTISPECIES: hypothetical protein [Serratia]QBX66591.1 hypothetical protein E4343_10535 [Serratia quinivorans]